MANFMAIVAALGLTFGASIALIHVLRWHAPRLGLVDDPSWRKQHIGAVPLVGGIAMFIAIAVALSVTGAARELPLGVCLGGLLIVALGTFEDARALQPALRLAIEAIAVFMATAASGVVLTDLGHLLGPETIALGWFAVPFTIFAMVGVVNAVNLSDGLDGLAGGIALTATLALGAVFMYLPSEAVAQRGFGGVFVLLTALAGALVGFLLFNMRTPWRARADVFMGDAGSLFLGFTIGWLLSFVCSLPEQYRLSPVSALWILIVPLFDTLACMLRRKLRGRSPLRADAYHVHHLLKAWGCTPGATVAVLVMINGFGALVGVAGWRLGIAEHWMFISIALCFALYFALVQSSWQQLSRRRGSALVLVRAYPQLRGSPYQPTPA